MLEWGCLLLWEDRWAEEDEEKGMIRMEKPNYKRTKRACYFANLAMSSVFSLPPLLFATFREQYGISYTLLGTLVLVNFCTQLGIDLIFSFFGRHFNIHKTIRLMPLVTAAGLCVYALIPMLFPGHAYMGLVAGTFLFSVAAGLGEVLVSPAIAALPSDTPDKDMSMLHALYGYGFVGVVLISTLFLRIAGNQYWMYLTFFWAMLPVIASVWLRMSPLPDMNMEQNKAKSAGSGSGTKGLLLCMACIFLGACAENTMSNWVSVYAEKALRIPKVWGDILGMSLFAGLLALTRTIYAKYGKNIFKILTISMWGGCGLLSDGGTFLQWGIVPGRLCRGGNLHRHALAWDPDFYGRENTCRRCCSLCADGGGGRPWGLRCAPGPWHRCGQDCPYGVGRDLGQRSVADPGTGGI